MGRFSVETEAGASIGSAFRGSLSATSPESGVGPEVVLSIALVADAKKAGSGSNSVVGVAGSLTVATIGALLFDAR
ncbi:MAG: hypothetical protein IPK80_19595 [Nannocystis sp.]|nr:hypothetical protein [Nannocystis sp.]MBK8263528.1 hypothetical protein [Nannocystis sp.]